MNVVSIATKRPVYGLSPALIPAVAIGLDEHLQCGACGFQGAPTHYIFSDGPDWYEPVCDCPLPAVLNA